MTNDNVHVRIKDRKKAITKKIEKEVKIENKEACKQEYIVKK